jgi:hypothetical protein
MVNIVNAESFHIHDKNRPSYPSLREGVSQDHGSAVDHIQSRAEKFCAPNGGVCTSNTVGLLARRHIVAGGFHYIGKEASTRWGADLIRASDPGDETGREYERVVDAKYLFKSGQKPSNFPISCSLASPKSPAAQ